MPSAKRGFNNVNTGGIPVNQPHVTDWGNQNNGWTGANNGTVSWPSGSNNVCTDKQTTDLFGSSSSAYTGNQQVTYDITHVLAMLRDAGAIYDRGAKPRIEVAKEVDKLRRRISAGTFDPHDSPELKNIFGYMFGDVIAGIYDTNGGDYDSILDYIMDTFPEGSGGPVESKYVKTQLNNQLNNFVKAFRNYERRNGLHTCTTKSKFVKTLEQFRLAKPEVIVPDLDLIWEAYNG